MVLALAPWSVVLTPGKVEAIIPEADLQIKNAALSDELEDDSARTTVKLVYRSLASGGDDDDEGDEDEEDDDNEFKGAMVTTVLCSLTPGKIEQSTCDIILEQDMEYVLELVGKNTVYLYGNYIDQVPADQPPLGSDVGSDEENAYDLNEVSSDVEIPVDADELELDDDVEDTERFEEIQDVEQSPKSLKRSREEAMDVDEHEEKLSKSQRKKLAKKLKAADGKAAPAPEPEQKAEEKKVEKKKDKKDKKEKSEQKEGEKQAKEDKDSEKKKKKEHRTIEGGVKVRDPTVGSGKMAKKGDKLEIRYIGKFLDNKVFDKNTKGKPFTFKLGHGDVIKGWDIGVVGMQVGGERELIIPPEMGYGNKAMPDIPPNSTLKFEVKLLAIK